MKFAVIGCGSIGRRHIGNLLAAGHRVVAWNRGEERRQSVAKDFNIPVYADLDEMLDKSTADAAVVCSPNNSHVADAFQAATRGLHLFIEKPVAVSHEGLEPLRKEVAARKLITHVGTNMRFHPGPARLKELLDSGSLGRPLWCGVQAGMYLPDWHPHEDYRQMYSAQKALGGGAVMDFIHELDLAVWMFGTPDMIAAIAVRSGWLEIETEDIADMIWGYESGFCLNMHVDYLQKPFQRGIRIVGDAGWACWNLARQNIEYFEYTEGESRIYEYPVGFEHNGMYVEQMKYFSECIRRKTESFASLEAGLVVLDVALQCKASSEERKFMRKDATC